MMKDGQDAVMQRWLMSAQKLSCAPSVTTISRPPSRITCAFAVRSLKLSNMGPDLSAQGI
jgi:hypothetical protein